MKIEMIDMDVQEQDDAIPLHKVDYNKLGKWILISFCCLMSNGIIKLHKIAIISNLVHLMMLFRKSVNVTAQNLFKFGLIFPVRLWFHLIFLHHQPTEKHTLLLLLDDYMPRREFDLTMLTIFSKFFIEPKNVKRGCRVFFLLFMLLFWFFVYLSNFVNRQIK